jgi:NADPH-dependent ferric siderophore reductase
VTAPRRSFRPGASPRRPLPTRVRAVTAPTAHLREIELTGPDLPHLRPRPGAHLVVHVPDRRVYSIWRFVPREPLLTIRVVLHPAGGPGCDWARRVQPGDRVTVEPPRSKITLASEASFHLFIGDETGAVPLLAMRAALPHTAVSLGVFESAGPDDEMPAPDPIPSGHQGATPAPIPSVHQDATPAPIPSVHQDATPALIPWVHRGAAPAAASRTLLTAVRRLSLPAGNGTAYVAGESITCRLIQRHLIEERGWPRRSVLTQPQWTPGHPGFGAGPASD